MNIKKQDAGVWVKADDVPKGSGMYLCIIRIKDDGVYYTPASYVKFDDTDGWDKPQLCGIFGEVVKWLKPVTGYLLSEDELETVYRKGYNDMYNNAGKQYTPEVDFKQFIQSLTNQ